MFKVVKQLALLVPVGSRSIAGPNGLDQMNLSVFSNNGKQKFAEVPAKLDNQKYYYEDIDDSVAPEPEFKEYIPLHNHDDEFARDDSSGEGSEHYSNDNGSKKNKNKKRTQNNQNNHRFNYEDNIFLQYDNLWIEEVEVTDYV